MNQATLRTYFRVTSVAVCLVALAFALDFCLGQLFPDARAQIWLVMDPLMGASIIVSLIAQWCRSCAVHLPALTTGAVRHQWQHCA